jgi:hypothetical protein
LEQITIKDLPVIGIKNAYAEEVPVRMPS